MLLYVFVTVLLFYLLFTRKTSDKWNSLNAPPNPKVTPFLGNILTLKGLDPLLHLAYDSLCQQLGKVFRLSIAGKWIVVLSDFNHMKVNLMMNEMSRGKFV